MNQLKDKIIETSTALFMRYGFKSVSMDDVARELGISKKTLYQHVSTKKELINLAMNYHSNRDLQTIVESLENSSDAIDEYLRNSRYFIREMRKVSPTALYDLKKYYPNIWQTQMVEHIDKFIDSITQNIQRGIDEGLFRDNLNSSIIGKFYAQTAIAICDTSLFPAQEMPLGDIMHQHALYHLHGLVTDHGREVMLQHLTKENL